MSLVTIPHWRHLSTSKSIYKGVRRWSIWCRDISLSYPPLRRSFTHFMHAVQRVGVSLIIIPPSRHLCTSKNGCQWVTRTSIPWRDMRILPSTWSCMVIISFAEHHFRGRKRRPRELLWWWPLLGSTAPYLWESNFSSDYQWTCESIIGRGGRLVPASNGEKYTSGPSHKEKGKHTTSLGRGYQKIKGWYVGSFEYLSGRGSRMMRGAFRFSTFPLPAAKPLSFPLQP